MVHCSTFVVRYFNVKLLIYISHGVLTSNYLHGDITTLELLIIMWHICAK